MPALWTAQGVRYGGEPRHLAGLIGWFMGEVADDIPVRLHSRDTADDGDPEWHPAFRRYIAGHPGAYDRDGEVHSPLRFWLWVMQGESWENRVMAEFLYRLARYEGDYLEAVRVVQPLTEDGEILARSFARDALRRFWRRMQTTPRRGVRVRDKSEAQHAAEEGA